MTTLVFDVVGLPAPAGSKIRNRYGAIYDSNKKVAPWRQDVIHAAETAIRECGWEHSGLPCRVIVDFFLPRTKGHFGSGKNAHLLKPSAPFWPASKPDCDKLVRGFLDALGIAGVFQDDARVVSVTAEKRYADHTRPGAHVEVQLLTQDRHAYTRPRGGDDAYYDLPIGARVADVTVQEALL